MKDIVYTRKYTDQKGQERKEYITIGYLFEREGRISILMKSWINPAALSNEKGEVWLSVYEHKSKTQENAQKSVYKGTETVKVVQDAISQEKPLEQENLSEEDTECLPF